MSMLNRLSLCILAAGALCAVSTAKAAYWTVFNIEGESGLSADIVTYASLADMLTDSNRTGTFTPNPLGFSVDPREPAARGSCGAKA